MVHEVDAKEPLYLDRGDPFDDTPRLISLAGIQAIEDGKTHYADPMGTESLRFAIAETLNQLGMEYNPREEILVSAGASPAIFATLMALTSPGDSVLVPNPGWPTYVRMITSLGRCVEFYPMPLGIVSASPTDWYNVIRSCVSLKTRLLIINSPHNPTGTMLNAEWLSYLSLLCDEFHNLFILSDEPYYQIVFDDAVHVSPASIPQLKSRTILIRTFSKAYCMAGWRVGYVAAPLSLARRISNIHLAMNCCASSISQEAATWALTQSGGGVEEFRLRCQANRDFLIKRISSLSCFKCDPPKGTFYLFPETSGFNIESKELSRLLVESERVFIYPGLIYGVAGENHIRISFASKLGVLEELVNRLIRFEETWKNNH